MKLYEFIKSIPQLEESREICFFAGSFNPWHTGHTNCLKLLPVDKVLIVAPDHNPYKELVLQNENASNLDDISNHIKMRSTNTYLFDGFFTSNSKNPTHTWVQELKNLDSNKEISLLVGFDTFISIHTWLEAKLLLSQLSTLYVVSRLDSEQDRTDQIDRLRELNPNLKLNFLGNHTHEHVSSTKIRENS
jgi:nicotinate-nucleotide adenylyltransferase